MLFCCTPYRVGDAGHRADLGLGGMGSRDLFVCGGIHLVFQMHATYCMYEALLPYFPLYEHHRNGAGFSPASKNNLFMAGCIQASIAIDLWVIMSFCMLYAAVCRRLDF